MAKLSKEAKRIQEQFLPLGAQLAALTQEMFRRRLFVTARLLQQAQDAFQTDVTTIAEDKAFWIGAVGWAKESAKVASVLKRARTFKKKRKK